MKQDTTTTTHANWRGSLPFLPRAVSTVFPRGGRKVGVCLPSDGYDTKPTARLTEPRQMACVKRGAGMRCYSLREAATECGMSYHHIILPAVRRGELRAFVPAGMKRKRFVTEAELRRWVEEIESAQRTA